MTTTNTIPSQSIGDETTPLLSGSSAGLLIQRDENSKLLADPVPEQTGKDDVKPFPKTQVFLLCYARLVDPIAFFSIFSFINQMVWETGNIKETDVGFYSGLIESLFSLSQMLVLIPWGRAADRFGRKPTLVLSLAGMATASTLFGFSQTIWQMILCRSIAGLFAGTLVTLQTMLAELTTPQTQARAFSLLSFTTSIGILIGPLIGGVLYNPAEQYPGVFGSIQFFKDFPYALPTMATGGVGASAVVVTALFVKETLRSKVNHEASHAPPLSTWEVFKSPGVISVLFINLNIMVLAYGYTAIIAVFCFTEPKLGGLGFSPLQISMVLGTTGLMQALWIIVIFPPLQHRIGTVGVLRYCSTVWPIFFLAFPICNFLLRHNWTVTFWVVGPMTLIFGSSVAMAFTGIQLAINDISPTPQTLGTLNALALMLSSGVRASSPALFASIFAIGARTQILSGYLVWLILGLLAIGLAFSVRCLPAKAEGLIKRKVDEDEEE